MSEQTSAENALTTNALPFDGEPRDIDGVLSIAWEVRDDYGNVFHRASWRNGEEWSDPALADVSPYPALLEKISAARAASIKSVKRLVAASAPIEIANDPDEEFIPVSEDVRAMWGTLGLVLTDKAQPVPNADNCLRILENLPAFAGRIWLDEFSNNIMTDFSAKDEEREWTDSDTRSLWIELQRRLGLARIGKEPVLEAVMAYAHINRRHPVKEWLAATSWDRVPRLDTFFHDYMGAEDSALHRALSANFFVAMIARVFAPGCKVDNMIVLEGAQGAKKSSALKALCGKWFTECNEPVSNGSNKDFYAVLQGKMLVEIAELDSFSRADILRIKAIITTATDRYRPAYGRITQNFPRTSVFVGTTNEDEYLADATGGRRFWPVHIGEIRLAEIERDRAQLFAEALHRYRVKPEWWNVPAEEAAEAQENRRKEDAWEGEIQNWLTLPRMDAITSRAIADECLKIDVADQDQRTRMRISYCMKSLGYKIERRKKGSNKSTVWVKK